MFVFCKCTERANAEQNKSRSSEGILNPASINIEHLRCREDLNFKVNFRLNGAIGTVAI